MEAFRDKIIKQERVFKPGYTRLNIHYFMPKKEMEYILNAIEFIGKYGWLFLPHYKYNAEEGVWSNIDEMPYKHRLGDIFVNGDEFMFSSSIETLIN